MSELDELVQRLKNEVAGPQTKSASWKRFDDTVNSMSNEQRVWVSKQDNVLKAENAMMSSFLEYLFNQNREAFASVEDGRYGHLVEDYISEIQKTGTKYVSRSEMLEKENRELKDRLEDLIRRENEYMAANGTGRGGKGSPEVPVRTDGDTGCQCKNLDLFEDQPK